MLQTQITDTVLVNQGDLPGQLHVTRQDLWYVIRQYRRGSKLLSTMIIAILPTKKEADKFKNRCLKSL